VAVQRDSDNAIDKWQASYNMCAASAQVAVCRRAMVNARDLLPTARKRQCFQPDTSNFLGDGSLFDGAHPRHQSEIVKEVTMSNTPNNGRVTRFSTETKAAFKTTEFIAYVVILIAMFIASAVVDNGDDGQGFGASSVWLYATLLTIGYMISRGLAKSGSREHYDADHDSRR
jgi:hypothetical protein